MCTVDGGPAWHDLYTYSGRLVRVCHQPRGSPPSPSHTLQASDALLPHHVECRRRSSIGNSTVVVWRVGHVFVPGPTPLCELLQPDLTLALIHAPRNSTRLPTTHPFPFPTPAQARPRLRSCDGHCPVGRPGFSKKSEHRHTAVCTDTLLREHAQAANAHDLEGLHAHTHARATLFSRRRRQGQLSHHQAFEILARVVYHRFFSHTQTHEYLISLDATSISIFDLRVVAFLLATKAYLFHFRDGCADVARGGSSPHAVGLLSTSQLSHPRTQRVAPHGRIA